MGENAGILGREMRALASRGGIISAFVILLVGVILGAISTRAIYKDDADHWKDLYQNVQVRRGLSDKDLKIQALQVSDKLDGVRVKEQEASRIATAAHSAVSTLGFASECTTRRSDARGLRDEILQRIATAYRDSAATNAYEAPDCIGSLNTVINDLRAIARKLPD